MKQSHIEYALWDMLLCTRLCCITADTSQIGEPCFDYCNQIKPGGVFGRVTFNEDDEMKLKFNKEA